MLGWNKEFLLKRRVNTQHIQLSQAIRETPFEKQQALELESSVAHLRKLIYLYLNQKFNNAECKEPPDHEQFSPISMPLTFQKGNQEKLISIINRRIMNVLFTFGKPTSLEGVLEQCYQKQVESEEPCSQDYFREVQAVLIGNLLRLRKIKKKTVKLIKKESNDRVEQKKMTLKEVEQELLKRLYNIIDVVRIEAIDYYIEGVGYSDNVSLILSHQKPRNRKVKKQIKQYEQNYNAQYNKRRSSLRSDASNSSVRRARRSAQNEQSKSRFEDKSLSMDKKRSGSKGKIRSVDNKNRVALKPIFEVSSKNRKLKLKK